MKNEAGMGCVFGPDPADVQHTIRCPFPNCKFSIVLRRTDQTKSVAAAVGIQSTVWENADPVLAGGEYAKDWEQLFELHVDSHEVAEIVNAFRNFKDRIASLVNSMQNMNDFADELATNSMFGSSFIRELSNWAKRNKSQYIPEQLRPLITMESGE